VRVVFLEQDEVTAAEAAVEGRENDEDGDSGDEGGGGEDDAAKENGDGGPAAASDDDEDHDEGDAAAPFEDGGEGVPTAVPLPNRPATASDAEGAKAGEESEYEGGEGAMARGIELWTDNEEENDDDDVDDEKKDNDGEETDDERGKGERRGPKSKPGPRGRRYPHGLLMAHQAKIAEETTAWDDDDWREALSAPGDEPGGCGAPATKPPFKALFPDPSITSPFKTKRVLSYLLPSPSLEKLYDDRLRAARKWDESRLLVEAARQSVAEAEERVRIEEAGDAKCEKKLKAATREARLAELDEPCRWNDMVKKMEDYKAEAGNVDLPEPVELNRDGDGTDREGATADKYLKELSRFGQEIRHDYREWKLQPFPHIVSAVDRLGFKWDDFDRKLDRMKEYKRLHGHCRVKKTDGHEMYDCYRYLRHLYLSRSTRTAMAVSRKQAPVAKGPVILTDERLASLVEVMDSANLEHTSAVKFEAHIEVLRKHRAENGNCVHPVKFEREWLRQFQRAYELWMNERGADPARIPRPLTKERLKVLKKVGACMTKNCECVRAPSGDTEDVTLGAKNAGDPSGKLDPNLAASWRARRGTDLIWEKRFNRLSRYKAEHGNFDLTYRDSKTRNLYALLRDLRRAYREYVSKAVSGKVVESFVLDDRTAGRLRDIVGEKDLLEKGQVRFEERLARLRKHRSDTGHCVFLDDKGMADWVKKVRHNYSLMKLGLRANKDGTTYGYGPARIDPAKAVLLDETGLCWKDECECPNAPRKPEKEPPAAEPVAFNPPPPFANQMPPVVQALAFNPGLGQTHVPLRPKRTRQERENEPEEDKQRRKKERKRRKEKERLEALAIMESMKGKFDQQSVTLGSL